MMVATVPAAMGMRASTSAPMTWAFMCGLLRTFASPKSVVNGNVVARGGVRVSDYGRGHRPPTTGGSKGTGPEDPKRVGAGVEADREWARNRIRNHFAANRDATPMAPSLQRKA